MSANNIANFTGRIAVEPTIHESDNDEKKTVVNVLLITVTDVYKDRNTQEWVEKTSAVPVTFFYPASLRAKKMMKGDLWTVTGPMISDKYTDNDGHTRHTLDCQIRNPGDLSLCSRPKGSR